MLSSSVIILMSIMVYFPIQTHPTLAHKKAAVTQDSRHETYQFPDSNSLTSTDEKYFEMVHNEANWNGKQQNYTYSNTANKEPKDEDIKIDRHGAPDSNSLTEIDREYFNIVKTEDGLSQFFKTKVDPHSILQFKRLERPVTQNPDEILEKVSPLIDKSPEIIKQESATDKHPSFKFHIVSPDQTNKNKKPIVGLYLGQANNS